MSSNKMTQDEIEKNGELIFAGHVGQTNDDMSYNDEIRQYNGDAVPQALIYDYGDEFIYVFETATLREVETHSVYDESAARDYLDVESSKNEDTTIGGEITITTDKFGDDEN